ncbi:PREDICTED: F-box/FBD/LRR-repeat protein At3g52680-like [Camelina sativa]|uniref:F-box/FBD/LRR-repeat protein At3g52680-like n=1 Tax=Camelina sativa TaxID=90675 RepID=A0ABM0TTU0_CAMSA|nr:PREDICTED: F-box/FBD/LRR-repeat protein At3g52680-like [Camelina sativa]
MKRCLRIRVVMGKDRITELPEELLLQILSLPPTKTVITTSVLSKRWRSLWKLVPKLKFESDNQEDIAKFSENVGRFLLSHKPPVLESLHIKVIDKNKETRCSIDVGVWVGIAIVRHVRELVLDLFLLNYSVRFPSSVFSCDTLETLKLKCSVLADVPSTVCMKSLRTLHLVSVGFKDNESVRNLISGCPNLEDLLIHRATRCKVLTLVIAAPSLKRLSIHRKRLSIHRKIGGQKEAGGYVINAPSLEYLKIRRFNHCECCLIENAPVLVKATISNVSYIGNEKILGSLKSAKRLSLDLSPLEIKCPTGAIFYQLVYLEMYTREAEWWNLLMFMLDISPKLQVLKLIDHDKDDASYNDDVVTSGKWNEPKYVPECLSSCLETFVWIRYGLEREEEKEVATYILKNAELLKKATFSTRPIESEELNKLEERRKLLLNELSRVKASNSCHLVFDGESIII